MSTFTVSAEQLVIHVHPNADALELAQVGLYRAVVPKGVYVTGDWAVYIPEQAVLPLDLIDELGLTGKLAGKGKDRVKAIRLRGELSQGIVCRPAALRSVDLAAAAEQQVNFADDLGIAKWVPEIPVHMAGKVEAAVDLLGWIEIENIRRYPGLFETGEEVTATEKTHGTCSALTYVAAEDRVLVSSKGYAKAHQALVRDEGNLYWCTLLQHGVDQFARSLSFAFGAERVGVYGEVYGAGVQDLTYGMNAKTGAAGYALFDSRIVVDGVDRWLSQDELVAALSEYGPAGLAMTPRLYEGPYDFELLAGLAEGREQLSGSESNIREGLVVRPKLERTSPVTGGRAIGKIVSEAYLMRSGGTEYE